jgi:hypothetical protein
MSLAKKLTLTLGLIGTVCGGIYPQKAVVVSPNHQVRASLYCEQPSGVGAWYLTVQSALQEAPVVSKIALGLVRSDQSFAEALVCKKVTAPLRVNEQYTALHGKRSHCSNAGNEVTVSFENPSGAKMNLIVRAYNDGLVFRYAFPEKSGSFGVKEELTAYQMPDSTTCWLEKFNPANEGLYAAMPVGQQQQDWGYPALFQSPGRKAWCLIHEADLNRSYCGTKLSNKRTPTTYQLVFPDAWNGRGKGASEPTIELPWQSPWRVLVLGSLSDIVESTLVDDVSPPSVLSTTDWIKPGIASWNYWSDNHGTRNYQTVCAFADLAAEMGWPYTLLDWEWDTMGNGGKLEDALAYIQSKGLKPLMWYNSGGDHTWVASTPKDRMLTHQNRVEEFTKLKKWGVVGIKVDFFESEKQDMIRYYMDILEDAAAFQMMVYFHGCLVPRGWARTYPNLMTYEGVRGAEWYNNGPEFTTTAPEHNTVLPFTRNTVGSMDYTPVTFTNSQYPHITSYGHELALSVVFESGIQHFADRPEGYLSLPASVSLFLRNVPTAWDDTRFLDGYPGKDIVLARRKGSDWYLGGISAENRRETTRKVSLAFLPKGVRYQLTLITDGIHDKAFSTQYLQVDQTSTLTVKCLRRGGFVGQLRPL